MESNQKGFDPLESFTPQQIADLGQSINTLEQEEKRILQEEQEDEKIRKFKNKPFRRLRASPIEVINRSLFFVFLSGFFFSFFSVYAISRWWLCIYIMSLFSCILYTPNRKALKELLDASLNIADLIKGRRQ